MARDDAPGGPSDAWLDEVESRAWRAFFGMQEQVRSGVERQLKTKGLSLADYSVLVILSEAPGKHRRMFELCDDLGWERSRLHHQLTRMVRRGLVQRHADPAEPTSRAVFLELTEAGLRAIVEAAPTHAREVRKLFIDHLGRQQLEDIAEIAATVVDANGADAQRKS